VTASPSERQGSQKLANVLDFWRSNLPNIRGAEKLMLASIREAVQEYAHVPFDVSFSLIELLHFASEISPMHAFRLVTGSAKPERCSDGGAFWRLDPCQVGAHEPS
jgi:hypothetical protein